MCGINGILRKREGEPVGREAIDAMRLSMVHRGPDEDGIYLDGEIGLGHQRLSIIGLSSGRQPMSTPDNRFVIVYNGETYNYRALRDGLIAKGHDFQTGSDTEVVLKLFVEYGRDCVSHMNGLFAFAIWDREARRLFAARDRLGIKPFYYVDSGEHFLFGSEIKSLLASGLHRPAINAAAVAEYFEFRHVAGTQTLFADVKSLLPGHCLEVSARHFRQYRYWHPTDVAESAKSVSLADVADELEERLVDSVKMRLMSEVPLGTFCSGGVDSSLVTAIAAKASAEPINTFSIGFEEEAFDESKYAISVSEHCGTRHHELVLGENDFCDLLPKLIVANDEPLNFANSVHIYALSKLAKEYVTVVLTGEGADELFVGYPRYFVPKLVQAMPGGRSVAGAVLRKLAGVARDHRVEKLANECGKPESMRISHNSAVNAPDQVQGVLAPGLPQGSGYRQETAEQNAFGDVLARLSRYDQATYLVSILNRQDKMSMAASVEARVPFLDYRIAEFANRLKSDSKTHGLRTKQAVKMVAERYLPISVVKRKKSGFGVPLRKYFANENGLAGTARRLFEEGDYGEWLRKETLLGMLDEHRAGSADRSEMLWTATNFLIWKERYGL